MTKSKRPFWIGGLVIVATLALPFSGIARERDNPTKRQQALDEWYNETYAARDANGRQKGLKKSLWTAKYERFLLNAAKRERIRYQAKMPRSGTSRTVIDPGSSVRSLGDTLWTSIGPTKANYATNGYTLNVTDTGRVNEIVTDPADPNTIYVAFSGGGVWKSTDGGAFWNAKTETLGTLSTGTLEMDPNSATTLYLGLGDTFDGTGIGLVKSTDGADSWSDPVFLGDSSEIADLQVVPSNSNIVLAATNKGLYRSINAGASFTKVTIATGQAGDPYIWSLAWGGGSNFVLSLEANPLVTAGTTDGQIWRSTDNGETWTRGTGVTDTAGVGRITIAAAPSNRDTLYAMAAKPNAGVAADLANLFKSTDGGVSWTGIGKTGATYKAYTNANGESANLGTLTGGQGWYNHAIIVDPSNENVAYFGGQLLLSKTSDGGGTYTQVSNWLAQFSLPYVHADFHAAHFASNGTLYIGTDGGIFRSTDNAATFTDALNEGIASHLVYQVGSSPNNTDKVIIGLQDNGTRVREGTTGIFNQEIGGDGFACDVNRANANLMLGSLYYNRIQRSTDGGLNFTAACSGIAECNNPAAAPFRTFLHAWQGDATGNTLFTYSNAKAYKTTNYATSWTALGTTGLPGSLFIRGIAAAPTNPNVIGLVANGGRVILSSNGGSSWTTVSPALLPGNGSSLSWITFDRANANIIYVASVAPDSTRTHLWRSADGGASWTALDGIGSGFPTGIPVNAIEVDAGNPGTLYAATHLGIYKSTNTGASWTRHGTGLPLVNVTGLYISPDGALMRASTFGRAVWELSPPTGNQNPIANYTSSVTGLTVNLTDTSIDNDGTIASRSWSFGDGTTSTDTNPSKTYTAGGTYYIALTVTDNAGATNTVTKAVSVTNPSNTVPVANYTHVATDLVVAFTDASTDADGTIVSRSWNFGDATTSTATNPSKTYGAGGTYNVALTVTDNEGATHTVTKAVTVVAPPPTVLVKGVAVTGQAAATGINKHYTMDVPAGVTNLTFTMSGGTGDADMYVRYGSTPTNSVFDCRPYLDGNAETCTFPTPTAGTYYVRLNAYAAFSGVSLVGDWTPETVTVYTNPTDIAILDKATVESPIVVSGRTGNGLLKTAVQVTIAHTYKGDLKVELIAPDNTVYLLHNRSGGSADNINQVYTVNLTSEAKNGTWKLRVNDNATGDTGKIDSWSITL